MIPPFPKIPLLLEKVLSALGPFPLDFQSLGIYGPIIIICTISLIVETCILNEVMLHCLYSVKILYSIKG